MLTEVEREVSKVEWRIERMPQAMVVRTEEDHVVLGVAASAAEPLEMMPFAHVHPVRRS